MLAAGMTQQATAHAVGCSRSTICRWLEDEEFRVAMRRTMENNRHAVEARVFGLASEAAPVIQKWLRSDVFERQATGAKLAMQAAARFAGRYKELQVEGYVPPPAPLVIFPPGTVPPYLAPLIDVSARLEEPEPLPEPSDRQR